MGMGMGMGTITLAACFLGSPMVKSEILPTPASTLSSGKFTITPSELKWDKGFFGGSPHAAILGDETKPGLYVYRTLVPKGQRTPVHIHPDYRFVVVGAIGVSGARSGAEDERCAEAGIAAAISADPT